jgi:hypothetical protein
VTHHGGKHCLRHGWRGPCLVMHCGNRRRAARAGHQGLPPAWVATHQRTAFGHAHCTVVRSIPAAAGRQTCLAAFTPCQHRHKQRQEEREQQRDGEQPAHVPPIGAPTQAVRNARITLCASTGQQLRPLCKRGKLPDLWFSGTAHDTLKACWRCHLRRRFAERSLASEHRDPGPKPNAARLDTAELHTAAALLAPATRPVCTSPL